jgi:hypothetical protein
MSAKTLVVLADIPHIPHLLAASAEQHLVASVEPFLVAFVEPFPAAFVELGEPAEFVEQAVETGSVMADCPYSAWWKSDLADDFHVQLVADCEQNNTAELAALDDKMETCLKLELPYSKTELGCIDPVDQKLGTPLTSISSLHHHLEVPEGIHIEH